MIKIKRVYEQYEKNDGYRILVDRLWPRGVSKEKAHIDEWMREIAPTDELRKWFNHDLAKWSEFEKKYIQELKEKGELLKKVGEIEKKEKKVTLIFAARNTQYNNALVLLRFCRN